MREPGHGHPERAHELERDGHAERDVVERLVEGQVHPGERHAERERRASRSRRREPAGARSRRAAAPPRHPEEDRAAGAQVVEEGLGERTRRSARRRRPEAREREPARAHRNPRHNRGVATTVASAVVPAAARPLAYEELEAVFRGVDAPFALVDLDAIWSNAAEMLTRAAGKPIRVASKSVRCRALQSARWTATPASAG